MLLFAKLHAEPMGTAGSLLAVGVGVGREVASTAGIGGGDTEGWRSWRGSCSDCAQGPRDTRACGVCTVISPG